MGGGYAKCLICRLIWWGEIYLALKVSRGDSGEGALKSDDVAGSLGLFSKTFCVILVEYLTFDRFQQRK